MIRCIRLEPTTRHLAGRVENAAASWSERRALLITLEGDDNAFGQGEAAPLPQYSQDSLEECRAALETLSASSLSDIADEPDVRRMLRRALDLLPAGVPAARFALETALLDLRGRTQKVPAWRLLRTPATPSLPLAALIGSALDPDLRKEAERARLRGISTFKVKIGAGELRRELEALKDLKTALPLGSALRLDANQSLSISSLSELGKLGPEFVEEPVPTASLLELRASFVPLALDESLQERASDFDLSKLLAIPNVRAVVLKPMALGGIVRCTEIAGAARDRGIDVVVSHTFDGPLGFNATAALAFDVGSAGLAMGLDRHAGLDAWGLTGRAPIASGRLIGWEGHGLGLPRFGGEA